MFGGNPTLCIVICEAALFNLPQIVGLKFDGKCADILI